MSIIEKLGTRQIPRYTVIGVFEDDDKYEMCLEKNVKELEHQNNEMLRALIDIHNAQFSKSYAEIESTIRFTRNLIEKVSDKTWSKIKELI